MCKKIPKSLYNGYIQWLPYRVVDSAEGYREKKEMESRRQTRDKSKEVHYVMRLRVLSGIRNIKLGGDTKNGK